jgi:hypothetical protein
MAEPRSRSPFPGMDPYLEEYWGDVHHALCTYSRDLLRRGLPPGLIARIDERTIIETDAGENRTIIPDVRVVERGLAGVAVMASAAAVVEPLVIEGESEPVTEGFVQIIDTHNGGRVVTVIEFTSPTHKTGNVGRQMYRQKQKELMAGGVNLVEVDLIRSGPWIVRVPEGLIPYDRRGVYQVCVSRGWRPTKYEVYPIRLQERLPAIRVPLRRTDPDAVLDLQALIDQVYENGSYGYDVDYTRPPRPPLPDAEAAWARERLSRGQTS